MDQRSVFKALSYRILEDPDFAVAVLGEDEGARHDALERFLHESDVAEERWGEALESVRGILDGVDLDGIAKLHVALDGIEPMAPL